VIVHRPHASALVQCVLVKSGVVAVAVVRFAGIIEAVELEEIVHAADIVVLEVIEALKAAVLQVQAVTEFVA